MKTKRFFSLFLLFALLASLLLAPAALAADLTGFFASALAVRLFFRP